MLSSSEQSKDQFRPKDGITEHTLNIRLVHCGKHSLESSSGFQEIEFGFKEILPYMANRK